MTKRMLIDSTQEEETRVVVVDGNKLEDVEFETSHRKQIKGNIYLAKVMRVEPSLQACFVDYGGNRHGFLAFGEIHPDYYNVSEEEVAAVEQEVNDIIEAKKQAIKEHEAERERIRAEKAAAYAQKVAEREAREAEEKARAEAEKEAEAGAGKEAEAEQSQADTEAEQTQADIREAKLEAEIVAKDNNKDDVETAKAEEEIKISDEEIVAVAEEEGKKHPLKKRVAKKRIRKKKEEELKVLADSEGLENESVCEAEDEFENKGHGDENNELDVEDDDDEKEMDFEVQKKLMKARKLYHKSKIQDVIKEGQILLVQVVKEERGNKGAALTTYLSLAGRYCVLMPNRIKSGGVSRKITNVSDRKRLKAIVKELPLSTDMSLIVRTAGEEKTKADIVRDYNYLIRSWNMIRLASLKAKAPVMIHEEGNLIKRALRDIYTKEIAEVLVAGDEGYKTAREFFKILSPRNLRKIKHYRNNDMPLFQRFQVEAQLDKLHEANAQLESGGYLVINPTEALVAIDVNSGRATKEKDLEETALKTNLEACDEIAKQLRMRNLAGLIVVDFIDMEEPANNHAIEKRMKEALKKDRSRIQVAKMSCFGLLEISRQRMHSSFMESNYQVCPHCHGQGVVRTTESSTVFVLRGIEEEGIKNRAAQINVFVPSEIAIYLLNQKRKALMDLEQKYNMNIIISADDSILNIADYRIERVKTSPAKATITEEEKLQIEVEVAEQAEEIIENDDDNVEVEEETDYNEREHKKYNRRDRRERKNRRGFNKDRRYNKDKDGEYKKEYSEDNQKTAKDKNITAEKKQEAVILYNSHEDIPTTEPKAKEEGKEKRKTAWWKKLIKS